MTRVQRAPPWAQRGPAGGDGRRHGRSLPPGRAPWRERLEEDNKSEAGVAMRGGSGNSSRRAGRGRWLRQNHQAWDGVRGRPHLPRQHGGGELASGEPPAPALEGGAGNGRGPSSRLVCPPRGGCKLRAGGRGHAAPRSRSVQRTRPIEATSNKRDIYRGRNTDTPRPSVHWATDHGRTAASITHTRTLIGLAQGQHSTVSRSLSICMFQRELPHIDRGMRTFMYTP